jgi:tRNA (cytidine/uridine-2'-O-)-methyltransferase
MFDIVLYQPEIPPNTGNIIRLCANSGARLHLIEPLGFQLDAKSCRRAGLDYAELACVSVWPDLQACLAHCQPKTLWVITKFGQQRYDQARFQPQDALLFGSETAGLPADLRASLPAGTQLFLPMQAGNRSLNLSNAVAAVLYEGWRQNNFAGS